MPQTATVDAAVERVMYEDKETVLALMDFQREGIDFYLSPDGLVYGGPIGPPGYDRSYIRADLVEWEDRIEAHFRRVLDAADVEPSPSGFYQYPNVFAAD